MNWVVPPCWRLYRSVLRSTVHRDLIFGHLLGHQSGRTKRWCELLRRERNKILLIYLDPIRAKICDVHPELFVDLHDLGFLNRSWGSRSAISLRRFGSALAIMYCRPDLDRVALPMNLFT